MKLKWKSLLNATQYQKKWLIISLSIFVLGCIYFGLTLSNVSTETYDMERFSNAKDTIRSPITIENVKETERMRREAVQAVEDRYNVSSEITQERIGYINEVFEAINKLEIQQRELLDAQQEQNEQLDEEESEVETVDEPESEEVAPTEESIPMTLPEKVQYLQQVLSPEIIEAISAEDLTHLVEASAHEQSLGKELLTTSLYDVLNEGVRTEDVQAAKNSVIQKLRYSSVKESTKDALSSLASFAVVDNSFYAADRTMEAQKQAINNVDPVLIRAGEVIVREGQTITNEIYEELELVGLLNEDRNIYPVIGLFILIVLLCGIMVYELGVQNKFKSVDTGQIASFLIISALTVLIMKFVSIYTTPVNQLYFLVPAATGSMLLKVLLHDRIAIIMSVIYAILGSIIFNSEITGNLNMEAGIYLLFTQLAGVIFLINLKDRTAILKAGSGITIVNILTVLIFLFLSFEKYTIYDVLLLSGYGIVGAFLSCVLTMGMLPVFEASFGILSDAKLLALSSPTHPLLRKILTEAPGTYHHSVMVANLSEASCEAIGANGLLARVAAYYHDLGKTMRPHYFIENQMGIKNPHDYLEPQQSAEIIISHPYDGAKMLKKYKIPKEIIDIAEQHHGTTLLKYFYYKAKESYKEVDEKEFRYPGPIPRTKEAAIVSICDSVEAAVRSLKEPSKEKIEEVLTSIINDRLMDGQLSDSSLTFRELEKIKLAISETLNGIYHSRIQYPTEEKVKEAN
ncbi:HD family phosphohydrolase [Aquibacillus koreensis]|uniref:HD family phosphohydrolase n=1 Tax=Aquibacillus koreensis TaxID=279446 RepID=A0A9X3WKN2_9BACI|nr:HD family phosphohydrolase [Aquibacillus koreensis]MCT2537598.1 HD family phosphohydrolase [Aquibacillus koreensis]MDC3419044.1 HD family phosphohydrolase [Aquibacillus koreensis]